MTLAKMLCEEAANLRYEDAEFDLKVEAFLSGAFDTNKNFQKGIRNAQILTNKKNSKAKKYLDMILMTSEESLIDMYEDLTKEDLIFLKDFLNWEDR